MKGVVIDILVCLACIWSGALLAVVIVVIPGLCVFIGFDADAWLAVLTSHEERAEGQRFIMALPTAVGMFVGFLFFLEHGA